MFFFVYDSNVANPHQSVPVTGVKSQALAYLVGLFNFLPAHSRYMRKLAIRDSAEPWTNMNPHRKCSYFPIYIYHLSETGSNNLAIRGLSPSDCDVQFVPGLDHRQDLAETRWVNNGPPSIGWGLAHRPPCTWKEALAPCHCNLRLFWDGVWISGVGLPSMGTTNVRLHHIEKGTELPQLSSELSYWKLLF